MCARSLKNAPWMSSFTVFALGTCLISRFSPLLRRFFSLALVFGFLLLLLIDFVSQILQIVGQDAF